MGMVVVEALAVFLALAYLVLAARENIWCWYCALASSALYVFVMWDARLLTEAVLNVFYVVMAVLGWLRWRRGGDHGTITSLRAWQHAGLLLMILALTLANGWAMARWTSAAWPFVDSLITWASVVTTFLVVHKVLENWLYWIVIDGLALVIYIERGLYMTAMLYALYLVIVVFGYYEWRKEHRKSAALSPAQQ